MADDDSTIDSNRADDPSATSKPGSDETIDSDGSAQRPEIRLRRVETIGDYDIVKEIARGGMGVVYQARHKTLNRTVALKMILSGQFASAADVRRFHQEAEAAANLDHPGIVPIYDVGEHEGRHYFSMKFIEGGSLAAKLPELREDRERVVRLIAQIARAMHHAHQRGILHRDLKPANILLDEDGRPLVSDLGLAKQIKAESRLTHTGAVVGTPAYMPPEQAAAKKEITTAADIYSLGAILYEALTGRPPFRGDSPVETMMRVIDSEVTRPREIDHRIDRTLELICLKCLEKDPDRRYSSAGALAEDLENWCEGHPVSVRPPSLGSALTMALVANLRSVIGAGLIGLLAGVVFAYFMSQLSSVGDVVANPPERIYQTLRGPIPIGRSLVFFNESGFDNNAALLGLLGVGATLMFTGWIVARLARPRPGTEALALAFVTSMMMSIALFATHIGFGGMAATHEPGREVIAVLTAAATADAATAAQARQSLYETYPALEALPADEQQRALAYRVYYDAVYRIPPAMWTSMLISVLVCTLPVLLGTTFGSKLVHLRLPRRVALPVYFEFMMLAIVLGFLIFLQTILPLVDPGANVPDYGLRGRGERQLVVYGFLTLMLVCIYRRRLRWYWRLAAYAGLLALGWVAS